MLKEISLCIIDRKYLIFDRNVCVKMNKIISNYIEDIENVSSPVTDPDVINRLTVACAIVTLTLEEYNFSAKHRI